VNTSSRKPPIVAALDVPVSADIEAGYEDVAATVTAVLQAGAAGVNIEDRRNGSELYEPAEQADRLAAARAAARGIPFWINARTDVFLAGTRRIDDALERSAAYAAAGADSLFVPGLVNPAAIAELAKGPLPVAVMVWPGAPSVAELAAAGAVRISLGSAIAQAAYAVAVRAATELLTSGTYDSVAGGIAYDTMNAAITHDAGLPAPAVRTDEPRLRMTCERLTRLTPRSVREIKILFLPNGPWYTP
jgi:2-methylisocitrate lyase-like PEP mutase family enzyme